MVCPQDLRRVLDLRDCPEVVLSSEELGTAGGLAGEGAVVLTGASPSRESGGKVGSSLLTGGRAEIAEVRGRVEVTEVRG